MTINRELENRWNEGIGERIASRVREFLVSCGRRGHGRNSGELEDLLADLPLSDGLVDSRDLRGFSFTGTICDLDLRAVDLSHSTLEVRFLGCRLSGAIFEEAFLRCSFGGVLSGCSFRSSDLGSTFFEDCIALECDFSGARLDNASFRGTDLSGSSFQEAQLILVDMFGANLKGCDFRGAVLREVVVQEATIDGSTDIRGATLIHLFNQELRDPKGKLVGRAVDFSIAKSDEHTKIA